jgi:hypothetical protein
MIDDVIDLLLQFDYLGKKNLDSGTILIGRAPHIAPEAWLHRIYNSLTYFQIEQLQSDCKHQIPLSYQQFLLKSNGLAVFNTTLSLYGMRGNYIRDIADGWQPFDLISPNTIERMSNATENMLIIGSYNYDGSKLYIDSITHKVHLCDRYNAASLFEWKSFDVMLEQEVKRLITLFDKDGKRINKGFNPLPNR